MIDALQALNPAVWVAANVLIAYIAAMLVVFVVAYPVFFDPFATTAGKFILLFALSLIGVIALAFIGLFIDPQGNTEWWQYPDDVEWWRPALRVAVYLCAAITVTGLDVVLWLRKFRPHRLKTAPEDIIPIKVRRPKE